MLDHTMLAPGPAGTSMIGESNIGAAARRGHEHRREEKHQRASLTGYTSEEDAHPEATALVQRTQMHRIAGQDMRSFLNRRQMRREPLEKSSRYHERIK